MSDISARFFCFCSLSQFYRSTIRNRKRVIDGDPIVLDASVRVRLIGVDTPETKHPNKPVTFFGKEASAFTKRMAEGKRVKLEYDQANTHLGHKDRYGRTFAFVFLEDGTLLNAEIIRHGYGQRVHTLSVLAHGRV